MQTSSVVPIQDIHALSHEVAEWLNDPFINNVVPPYTNGEGTGCDTIMETGDQLVGNTVPVTINGFTYHPQTQDVLQWFTRETPSSALGGLSIGSRTIRACRTPPRRLARDRRGVRERANGRFEFVQ